MKKPISEKQVSAFSAYSKEAKLHSTIKTKKKVKDAKKKSKSIVNIGKLLTSDTSKSVMKEILKNTEENKSAGTLSKIVPGKIPVLAQPDRSKTKKSKKMKIKKTKNDKPTEKQNLDTDSKPEKSPKSILKKTSISSNGKSTDKKNGKPKKNKKSAPVMKKVKVSLPSDDEEESCDSEFIDGEVFNDESFDDQSDCDFMFTDFLDSLEVTDDVHSKGKQILEYILFPLDIKTFFSDYWEKKPLLVKRESDSYMNGLFSTETFDGILRRKYVEFTKNLDVTSYSGGKRETHNPQGRAHAPVVWDYYSNGCSLRMLNPQTFCKTVWQTLSCLQEFMGSFCGANIYLTPAGSQGFAPHWDDIEAFIIQLEGKKRWRVYKPRNKAETLPRVSSANLTQEEIGDCLLDTVLEAGDLLYFPRGYIHQAEALEDAHSLHMTISAYQKTSWIDFMENLFSADNMSSAASRSVSLREGVPLGYSQYMGLLASDKSKPAKKRKLFKEKLVSLVVNNLLTDEMVDQAADLMTRNFVRVALPQQLTEDEVDRTVLGDGELWAKNAVRNQVEMAPDTGVRLCSPYSIRVVKCADNWKLFYSIENSREYMAREEQFLVLEELHLPALKALTEAYPEYVPVEDLLPKATLDVKMTLAIALWERCIIMTECPLEDSPFAGGSDDDDDEEGVVVH